MARDNANLCTTDICQKVPLYFNFMQHVIVSINETVKTMSSE